MTVPTVLRASLIAALVTLPLAAQAQTEGEAEAETRPGDLPLAQPVEEPGETYTAATHGAWEIRCIRQPDNGPEPCQMYQLLVDGEGNPVAEFNIFDLPDEGELVAGATIVTPLDTLLPPGIRVRVDDGQASELPFSFCQPTGCFARVGLTQANIDGFRAGSTAIVSMRPLPAPEQVVELEASLSGFTAAYEDLEARIAAARAELEAAAEAAASEEGEAASE